MQKKSRLCRLKQKYEMERKEALEQQLEIDDAFFEPVKTQFISERIN